jgi:hypothetical protein
VTEQKLIEHIKRGIQKNGSAKVTAMEVFNLLEPTLKASWEFTDAVVDFANNHEWDVYPVGEVPFGELIFTPQE